MSDTQIVETPEATTTEPTQAVVTEQPKETFDQTLERIGREITTGGRRDENGRFQPRVVAPGAPEAPELPGKPEAAAPEVAVPPIDAPQSLPDDVKKAWPSLPRAIQEAWSKRESEAHEKITADGQRLKSLSAYDDLARSLDARLKQVNAPAPEYFRRLAAADQLLATNGIEGLRQIAQMYGIDLRAAFNGYQPGHPPTPQAPDVNAVVQEKVEAALREQRVAEKAGEIDKFRKALPTDEQSDFDRLENVMLGLAAGNQNWTLEQVYKAARRADPDTSAKDATKAESEKAKQAEAEARKKQEQDARLAPLSRKPGSVPTGPIKGKSIWDTLEKVGKEVTARN